MNYSVVFVLILVWSIGVDAAFLASDAIKKGERFWAKRSVPSKPNYSVKMKKFRQSQLHKAAADGDVELVKGLLKGPWSMVKSRDSHGSTPLHEAARNGNPEIIQLLIDEGADVIVKERYGLTPLHLAVSRGHLKAATTLISAGADINAQSNDGSTPLHQAVWAKRYDAALLLIKEGADQCIKNNDKQTALETLLIEQKDP